MSLLDVRGVVSDADQLRVRAIAFRIGDDRVQRALIAKIVRSEISPESKLQGSSPIELHPSCASQKGVNLAYGDVNMIGVKPQGATGSFKCDQVCERGFELLATHFVWTRPQRQKTRE